MYWILMNYSKSGIAGIFKDRHRFIYKGNTVKHLLSIYFVITVVTYLM